MNVTFSNLLFILLDCVTNEKPPCAKGCHVPLTAFYRPVKALIAWFVLSSLIRWVVIYPVDSLIQPLNNRGLNIIEDDME